jgi:hypothetical protein
MPADDYRRHERRPRGLILDVFVPAAMQPELMPPDVVHTRDSAMFFVLGRPSPGVTRAGVAARMSVL